MNHLSKDLYTKIFHISQKVKNNLSEQGFAIPVKNDDGTISVGNYTIIKNDIFYSILDYSNSTIIEKINLPQTALLLANKLALGKFIDKELLQLDRAYGYAVFEEQLENTLIKRSSLDIADLRLAKASIARIKKENYKNRINLSFEKLRKII
jgi:hypothetical protein